MDITLEKILKSVIKQSDDNVTKNKIKINRFASKYENVRTCFITDTENDDLYNFLFDISQEFDIPEEDIYFIFMESKYDYYGEISKDYETDFAIQVTICETIKKK